jgi:hypothetical protein
MLTLMQIHFSFIAILAAALVLSFVAAWFAKTEVLAYLGGLGIGFVLLFGPSCIGMFDQNPVQANLAAESFFWGIPLLLGWAVLGVIAVSLARKLRRVREGSSK